MQTSELELIADVTASWKQRETLTEYLMVSSPTDTVTRM